MASRKTSKPTAAAPDDSIVSATTRDSFQNFRAQLGIGAANLLSGAQYGLNPITRDRTQLEQAYRGSWIVRAAVKTVADDMTREGIEIISDIDPEDIAKINRGFSRMKIWGAVNEMICWARLYGGAIGVILIDGQKLDTPLRLETVGKNQFKGLCVLDRWMVQPPGNEVIKSYGPDLGQPRYYEIIGDSLKLPRAKVHHSRVLRFDGDDLPYYQRVAENGWGLSVVEPLYDQLVAFDSATLGTGQLVFKAHLRTLKVAKLREILAMGGKAKEALVEQMNNIRLFQSSEGLTLLDGTDEFDTHTYSFSGLSDVLQQFSSHVAGALGVPVTRLFGTSPGGLNSTGSSETQNYYDRIKQEQEDKLRSEILKVLGITHQSTIGRPPASELDFEFVSLWQMDENMKADIAQKNTATIISAAQEGVVSRKIALEEMKQQSTSTGMWTNISQEDIDEAANDPPPQMQVGAPGMKMGGDMGAGGAGGENPLSNGVDAGEQKSDGALNGAKPPGAAKPDEPQKPHAATSTLPPDTKGLHKLLKFN